MKKIGLLGGMSWESSALYYRIVNEAVRSRVGGLHSAACLLASVDFAAIAELQRNGRWPEAGEVLAREASLLEAGGAEVLILCTNTMHKVADRVQAAVSIPLLHLGDVTGAAVVAAGLDRVGFLGTGFTMDDTFQTGRIASHGIEVLLPDPVDREAVHRIIYDELVLGVVREQSRERYLDVMNDLVGRGAQGVILGCTEIELLIGPEHSPVPLFPTTRLHAEAAVDWALR